MGETMMSIQELPLQEAAERLAHLAYHLARHGGPAIDVAQDLMKTSNQLKAHALGLDEQRQKLARASAIFGELR